MATIPTQRSRNGAPAPLPLARWLAVFSERVEPEIMTRPWQALAYFDSARRKCVMVIWPFHYAVRAAWWLNWKWNRYRHKSSWIDQHAEAAIKAHDNRPRYYR